jgi:hypothetical protein
MTCCGKFPLSACSKVSRVWLFWGRVARRGLWPERTTHLMIPSHQRWTTGRHSRMARHWRLTCPAASARMARVLSALIVCSAWILKHRLVLGHCDIWTLYSVDGLSAGLSLAFAIWTPWLLSLLPVQTSLRPSASLYIYWRGSIAWAALAQGVYTHGHARDAVTPLKIVGLAALVNVVWDSLLCAWPLQLGCAGVAAAAAALATLTSCAAMMRALSRQNLLPAVHLPARREVLGLLEFTGPLLAITLTRMGGIIAMQRTATATKLGVQSLARYQLCINMLMFFVLFGEPLSQLSQTPNCRRCWIGAMGRRWPPRCNPFLR